MHHSAISRCKWLRMRVQKCQRLCHSRLTLTSADVGQRWGRASCMPHVSNAGLAPSAPPIPCAAPLWRTSPISLRTYRRFCVAHMQQGGRPPASQRGAASVSLGKYMADETKGRREHPENKSQVPKWFSFETQKWILVSPQNQNLRKHWGRFYFANNPTL